MLRMREISPKTSSPPYKEWCSGEVFNHPNFQVRGTLRCPPRMSTDTRLPLRGARSASTLPHLGPTKFFSDHQHHYHMTNKPPHKHHRTAPKEDAVFLGVRKGDTLVFYCPNCRKHHRHGWDPSTPLWSLSMRVSHCRDHRTPWMYWIGISKELQKMME